MKACLNDGTLQAYLDGELAASAAADAAAHLSACPACAAAAREAAAEFEAFAIAFAAQEQPQVPTDALRARIAAAVAERQDASTAQTAQTVSTSQAPVSAHGARLRPTGAGASVTGRVRALVSSLASSIGALAHAPRGAAAFAGLALVGILLAAVFYTLRQQQPAPSGGPGREIAAGDARRESQPQQSQQSQPQQSQTQQQSSQPSQSSAEELAKIKPKVLPQGDLAKVRPKQLPGGRVRGGPAGDAAKDALLPGEKDYLTAIASLRSSIEERRLEGVSPTLRAEYERSVAVVDQAIAASRAAARRNPKDAGAQEFLRTAYQDKIELLSAVAERAQVADDDD